MITIDDIKKVVAKLDQGKVDRLASIFDDLSKNIAKDIREKGLPHHIFVHPDLYELLNRYLSEYTKVIKSPMMTENAFMVSWIKNDFRDNVHEPLMCNA